MSDGILEPGGDPDGGQRGATGTFRAGDLRGARAASVTSLVAGLRMIDGKGFCCCGGGPTESGHCDLLHERTWWPSPWHRRQHAKLGQTPATWSGWKQLKHNPTRSAGTGCLRGAQRRWLACYPTPLLVPGHNLPATVLQRLKMLPCRRPALPTTTSVGHETTVGGLGVGLDGRLGAPLLHGGLTLAPHRICKRDQRGRMECRRLTLQ
jgi:hypothetical protein